MYVARQTWWVRPQLRTDEDEDRERKVGWLELFFDLVFVVVVAEIAHELAAHVGWTGLAGFVVLFVPAWWLWIGMTFYTERFETNDVSNRLFTFLYMAPVAALAVFVHDGLGETSAAFALTYATTRVLLIFLWLRGGYHDARARPMTNRLAIGFSLSVALFVASVWVEPPTRFALWAVALGIDLVTPFFTLKHQKSLPRFSTSRLPERFGLFTIIVLGETVVGVVAGLAEQPRLTLGLASTGALGLGLGCGLWWLYFDVVGRNPPRPTLGWAIARNYVHLPLHMSIVAVGAGVLNVVGHEGEALSSEVRWLLTGSVAVALLSLAALGHIVQHRGSSRHRVRQLVGLLVVVAGASLLVGALGSPLSPLAALGALLVLLAVPIAYAAIQWVRGELAEPA